MLQGLRSEVQSDSEWVLLWIPVPNDELQIEQGPRENHSRVIFTFERSPVSSAHLLTLIFIEYLGVLTL